MVLLCAFTYSYFHIHVFYFFLIFWCFRMFQVANGGDPRVGDSWSWITPCVELSDRSKQCRALVDGLETLSPVPVTNPLLNLRRFLGSARRINPRWQACLTIKSNGFHQSQHTHHTHVTSVTTRNILHRPLWLTPAPENPGPSRTKARV